MTKRSPSTLYVLPTSGLRPGLPREVEDLAFRSKGVERRFLSSFARGDRGSSADMEGGRGRSYADAARCAAVGLNDEVSREDLMSLDTELNFSRTAAGI